MHHVVVVDGVLCFLDLDVLGGTEAIAEVDSDPCQRNCCREIVYIVSTLCVHSDPDGSAFFETGYAGDSDRELVVQEGFVEASHQGTHSVHMAVQLIVSGIVHEVEAQAQIPGQGMLHSSKCVELESAVAKAPGLALEHYVACAEVGVDTGFLAEIDIDEAVQADVLLAGDIAVGSIKDAF